MKAFAPSNSTVASRLKQSKPAWKRNGVPSNLRPLAEADLDNIVDYIARDNREAAHRVGRELLATAPTLAHSPRIGVAFGRRNIRYTVHFPY
jgi:hypothetical protein